MDHEDSLHSQLDNYITSSQWDRARDVAGELLAMQPESAWLHQQMGWILYQLDDYKTAEVHLKKSISGMPNNADAYNALAWLYFSMGRAGTADDNVKKALQLDPDEADSWFLSGNLACVYDDHVRAEYCLEQLKRLDPDSILVQRLNFTIQSNRKGKDKTPAHQLISELKKALEKDPEDCISHEELATLYLEEIKDYDLAETHVRQALRIDPTDKRYQRLLIAILRKKDPLLKALWLPIKPFTWKWLHEDEKYYLLLLPIAILYALFKNTTGQVILLIISLVTGFYLFLYPVIKLYEYLTLTELYHKMGKVHLFKGPFRKVHRFPYRTRLIILLGITLAFWSICILVYLQFAPFNR